MKRPTRRQKTIARIVKRSCRKVPRIRFFSWEFDLSAQGRWGTMTHCYFALFDKAVTEDKAIEFSGKGYARVPVKNTTVTFPASDWGDCVIEGYHDGSRQYVRDKISGKFKEVK